MGTVKVPLLARIWGKINWQSTEDFFRAVKLLSMILQWLIDVVIHLSKPTECSRQYFGVNSKIIHELCVKTMCQCRFTDWNTCITLLQGVDNGGGYTCVGSGNIHGKSPYLLFNFAINLKLFFKKQSLKKKITENQFWYSPTCT